MFRFHSLHGTCEECSNVVQVRGSTRCSSGVSGKTVERDTALGIQSLGEALYFLLRCFSDCCCIIAC